MDYPLMETPFVLVPFEEMNKKQVEQYYQWFMTEKDKRIHQLEEYINKNNTEKVVLDKSPESLIPLWEWFEHQIEWEERSQKEIDDEVKGKPEWMREIIQQSTKKMTILTMALTTDIATYFGETLIYNNPSIRWGYLLKPLKLDGVKEPILLGFKKNISMNPRGIVHVCVLKSSRQKNKMKLFESYTNWLDMVKGIGS